MQVRQGISQATFKNGMNDEIKYGCTDHGLREERIQVVGCPRWHVLLATSRQSQGRASKDRHPTRRRTRATRSGGRSAGLALPSPAPGWERNPEVPRSACCSCGHVDKCGKVGW